MSSPSAAFNTLPHTPTVPVFPFSAQASDAQLSALHQLVALSPIGAATYENTHASLGRRYGMRREWLAAAKAQWTEKFDWRAHEARVNSFPNFTASVDNGYGDSIEIHFLALFSKRTDAVPLAMYHGWPGSVLEFLGVLDLLREKYTPDTLPYHIVVPSLPGFGYSGSPPMDMDWGLEDAAMTLDALMRGLGLQGYFAQGGDLGAYVCQYQAAQCEACRGLHLNYSPGPGPENRDELPITEVEAKAMGRRAEFRSVGRAYALEHGTRTATIGLALSASPLALLSWVGEKFLEWSDDDIPCDMILAHATLYWLTDSNSRGLYTYRGTSGDTERPRIAKIGDGARAVPQISKPCGYSLFPKELTPMPTSWVKSMYNLVHSSVHTSGGHFAALEKPQELLTDVEEYLQKAMH